jgi:hypothetical protein
MNDRSLAISILQRARDTLSERLTERVVESRGEIEADADGSSYLSEIEAIYDQLGGRLAHVNAMLANLPSASGCAPADATASEIVYADLASAYPTGLDLEAAAPLTLLALPAPVNLEEVSLDAVAVTFRDLAFRIQSGQLAGAARLIGELFDIKPSQARRAVGVCERQIADDPRLAARLVELPRLLDETSEYSAAALLGECFEFPAIEALALARSLKLRRVESGGAG